MAAPVTTSAPASNPASPAALSRPRVPSNALARVMLTTFLFVFMAARILVFLIMVHRLPKELFFHVRGTHVHHLNYGIFILAALGGLLIFRPPTGRRLTLVTAAYGAGLALTFDEFGMWLHLGGAYWQRASFDAVVVIAALLAVIAYRPTLRHIRQRHLWTFIALLLMGALFTVLMVRSFNYAQQHWGTWFTELEQGGPP